jgi:hypothetical protein
MALEEYYMDCSSGMAIRIDQQARGRGFLLFLFWGGGGRGFGQGRAGEGGFLVAGDGPAAPAVAALASPSP